jgi:dolichyl-phosphate-mannose-protein mannosyltransferase
MSRQLFLHHYLPALYFSILLLAVLFDASVSKLAPRSRLLVAGVIAIGAIATYRHFSPLSYGRAWTRKECEDSKWRKTWEFSW